ncbi:MAG TPA: DUF3486 family protein [Candidatus Binataceae bacterium]|nr:DUF3486 family protein [Candidatus Binataceae bacterium]
MGERSKIVTMLPKRLREALDQKLIAGSFSHYRELESWLTEQGFAISRSAIQRYGSAFEQRVQAIALATDQARAITHSSPDDEAAMSEALQRLIQERIFSLLVRANGLSEKELPRLARAIADLGRTAVVQRRYIDQLRQRLEEEKAGAVKKLPSEGLSPEAAAVIRNALLDINPFRGERPPTVRNIMLGGEEILAPAELAAGPQENTRVEE